LEKVTSSEKEQTHKKTGRSSKKNREATVWSGPNTEKQQTKSRTSQTSWQ